MSGLYDRFFRTATRHGGGTAVEVQRRDAVPVWSYERLRVEAEAISVALTDRGIGPGDRCALLADNDGAWCAAFLGMLRIGAVPVPLDTAYRPSQIARLLEDSGARLIVLSPRYREVVARSGADLAVPCPTLPLEPTSGRRETETGAVPPAYAAKPAEPAVVLYTSGTTHDPKGVVLTHGNLLAEVDAALQVINVDEHDAVLGILPLFHALALVANLLLPLSVGARVVFLESPSAGELLRALNEREISAFCCVPQFFYLIHQRVMDQVGRAGAIRRLAFRSTLRIAGVLRERLGINLGRVLFARVHRALGPRMRLWVTGGSRFDPLVGRDLYRLGFNILQAYGLTESSGAATVLRPDDPHVGSVGQALPGVELSIVTADATGDRADEPKTAGGPVGEIAIRGAIVSPGYFRHDDANARTFRDGWLLTGDLGYLDRSGRLYVTGRAKEVIVLGSGKNVYPEEIEAHYARSPYVRELCVMGRMQHGTPASERLHAVVVPDFTVLRERKILNSREILRFEIENLSTQLPGYKRIMSYEIVADDLPRTTTRKLKRFEIESRFAAGSDTPPGRDTETSGETDERWLEDSLVSRVVGVLREAVNDSRAIESRSNLELDLGLDSMGRVELFASLESRLGASIPDDVAHRIFTVGELVEAVRAGDAALDGEAGADFDPWRSLLDEIPDDDPAVAPILVPRPWFAPALFVVAKGVYVLAWLLLGLRVSGREHLPRRGPFLISPNHQSFLDAFLLASALPFRVARDAFYVGASEYFATPLRAWVARKIHLVPVDADTNLVRAMRAGAHGLRRGKILILFPEGERSIDSEVKAFKKGAAILSLNTGAPVVPVALDGMFDVWPRARLPRLSKLLPLSGARARIQFGAPLEPSSAGQQDDGDYVAFTEGLRDTIRGMLARLREPGRR